MISTALIAIPVRDRAAIFPCENSDCRVASHRPGPAIATVVVATNCDLSLRHQSHRYLGRRRRRPGIVIADFDDADRHALIGHRGCPAGVTFLAVLWSGNGGYHARRRLHRRLHQLYYLPHPAVTGDRGIQTG